MSEKINLIFFAFGSSIPLVNELSAYYKNSQKFDVNSLSSVDEVNQFLSTSGQGIFFFKVTNKADLQKAVSVMKAQKKLIKNGFVKPACVTTIKNKKVETVLAKYGCVDLLEPDTRAKTASFKLDFWSKPITAHLEQVAREEARQLKNQKKDTAENEGQEKENFNFKDPLDLESDFWIVKHKNDCKKILRRWLLRILGPSPFIGNWVELQAQPGDKLPTWKFVLKDPTNTDYIKNEGAWFFYGAKPEFDWKINRWSFSSDLPHLYFYSKDGTVFSRFKFVNNQVDICKNSDYATAREEMILETCEAQYNFDGDQAQEEGKENLDGEEDNLGPGHLAGANHQEEDLAGNMEGKGSTDDLGGDPMSGKSSTDDLGGDPMSGKSSTDDLGGDPMSGKSSTDDLGGDPLSGKVNPGDVKPGEEKKDAGFSEDATPGHMGGKSSTDDLGGDPLSGKVNPGDVKPGEEKKDAGFSEDAIPGHMGGKSSTDDLGGDPLSGKVNPGDVKPGEEKKDAGFSEDSTSGPMGGKSSTDDLGGDPLSGKVNPGDVKPGEEKKDAGFSEDSTPGHMGGKSSTDDLGGDPLSGKLDPKEENKKSDNTQDGSIYDKDGKPLDKRDDLSQYQVMDGFNADSSPKKDDENPLEPGGHNQLVPPGEEVPVVEPLGGDTFANVDNPFSDDHSPQASDPTSKANDELNHSEPLGERPVEGIFDNSQDLPLNEKEADMLDALGGGFSAEGNLKHYEGSEQSKKLKNTIIGEEKLQVEEEGVDLDQIIGQAPDIDLESGLLKVVLKQKTNVGNDITFICEFEDFYEDELVVKAPKNSLAAETEVRAMVSLVYKGQKIKVECAGLIEEVEELSEYKDTLIISLTKINKEKYQAFISLYQERQGSINEFMEMAKGY